jgi:C-terminal processing protease CtpA/Prc
MAGKNFSKKYALAYGFPGEFRIVVQDPGNAQAREVRLGGVPASEIDRQAATSGEMSFRFLEGGRVGVLTVPSFGYYDRVEEFHAFMDSVFREIGKHGTGHLVMDLRGNSGGDPFCAAYLFSYLERAPSPYFEEHYGRYDTLALPLPQPAGHFKGKLYTLIDGGGFSTTGHFCALLKYHGIGTFIGEETGATYTCTGSAMYPTMDQTRIILGTARNRRYTAAVKGMDPRRGILPDHPVSLSPEDLVTGRDAVLEFALSLAQ